MASCRQTLTDGGGSRFVRIAGAETGLRPMPNELKFLK